jgi:multidrug resistance efflux pump
MNTNRRLRYLIWSVGLGVLCASVAGAGWVFQDHSANSSASAADPSADQSVVCFGYVDGEHGVTSLFPTQPGRVAAIRVSEGESVEVGTVLIRLEERAAQLRVHQAEADLDAAQAQLCQTRKLPQQHAAKVAQQRAAIEATERRLSAARHTLARKRHLQKIEQIPGEEVEAATDLVAELEAALRAERERLRELELVDPLVQVACAEALVVGKQAQRDEARHALDECSLRAPVAGTVLRMLVSVGDMLAAQSRQPAVLFCPRGPRIIRAEVEQEFAGRVVLGQDACIQDDSSAAPTWKGQVIRISDWYTQRRSIVQEPLQFNDVRTLECIIQVNPDQPPLRIGQRVRVSLGQLHRRP